MQLHPALLEAAPATAPAPGAWEGASCSGPPADPKTALVPHPLGQRSRPSFLLTAPGPAQLFPQEGVLTASKVTLRPHRTPWTGCRDAPPRALGHPRPRRPLASLAPAAPAAAHLSPRPIKGGTPRPLCPINAADPQGLGTRRGMNWDGLGGLDGLQPMAIAGPPRA